MIILKVKSRDGDNTYVQYVGPFPYVSLAEAVARKIRSGDLETCTDVVKVKICSLSAPGAWVEWEDLCIEAKSEKCENEKFIVDRSNTEELLSSLARIRAAVSVERFCAVTGISPVSGVPAVRYQGFVECALNNVGGEHPDYTQKEYEEDESVKKGESYAARLARELLRRHRAEVAEMDDV